MRTLLIVISIVGAWVTEAPARADALSTAGNRTDYTGQASQTWQILDYLADDYRGAVAEGRVVSASEYAEMREFADAVRTQLYALPAVPASSALQEAADRLARSIADKDAADGVARQAHALADALLAAYPIPTAPRVPPDLSPGAQAYPRPRPPRPRAAAPADG